MNSDTKKPRGRPTNTKIVARMRKANCSRATAYRQAKDANARKWRRWRKSHANTELLRQVWQLEDRMQEIYELTLDVMAGARTPDEVLELLVECVFRELPKSTIDEHMKRRDCGDLMRRLIGGIAARLHDDQAR